MSLASHRYLRPRSGYQKHPRIVRVGPRQKYPSGNGWLFEDHAPNVINANGQNIVSVGLAVGNSRMLLDVSSC